jgi:hypothetical protein
MMRTILYLLFIPLCWGCTHSTETAKYQNERDNVINVREKVKELVFGDVLINDNSRARLIIDDYLFISDSKSVSEMIHVFDKNNFNYIKSFADRGQGPGEIANIGHIAWDKVNRLLYVSDHGKQRIFSYQLDSVLSDDWYVPNVKMKLNISLFPSNYHYINDTLSIGRIIEPMGNFDFKQSLGKWNMVTGEIKRMNYEHPDIDRKRISFAVSMDHGIYAECYHNRDLMTICDLDGNLKYNIYGPKWSDPESRKISYYGDVSFCGDKILVLFSGKNTFTKETGMKVILPTKFLVFNLNGDYLQTLETGYHITECCYDSENNRIIMSLSDEIQFAYLDLDGLIV